MIVGIFPTVDVLTQSLIVVTALGLAKSSALARASNQFRPRSRKACVDGEAGAIPDGVRDPEVHAGIEPAQEGDQRLVALADLALASPTRRSRASRASRRTSCRRAPFIAMPSAIEALSGEVKTLLSCLRRAQSPEQREGEVVRGADDASARRR